MGSVNLSLPKITMDDLQDDVKLQKILSYLYQLNEQLRYELTHIDDDNISKEGITESGLAKEVSRTITVAQKLAIEVPGKVSEKDLQEAIDGIDEFHGTSVTITDLGVDIKTGGTFTVDSEMFDINENGEMSATNARISGQLSVDGNDVWHKGNIILSTVEPVDPPVSALWVKPDMTAIPAAGTWTMAALGARPWTNPYDAKLTGANIGAAPSGAEYIYSVSVPVYHKWENDDPTTCTVYLGASKGAETINMGTQSFKDSGTFKATITSPVWLGDSGTIYMRVRFSSGVNMSVNSHAPLSCNLQAKSQSATGWRSCDVQMYTG